MTKFKFLSVITSMLLLIVLTGTSCQKSGADVNSSSRNSVNEQKLVATNNIVEASGSDEENFDIVTGKGEYADVSDVASNAVSTGPSNVVSSGRTITYSPSKDVYPHTKTIDYGPEPGVTNGNGVTRSGKILVTYYTAAADAAGEYSLTTYDHYFVNGIHIEGSVLVSKTRNGLDQDVYLYTIDRKISDATGNVKDYSGNTTWTVINWHDVPNSAYEITGHIVGKETYNGIEANNFIIDVDENNPVIKPFTCKRVQGVLLAEINLTKVPKDQPNKLEESLNYGNGECDNIATLTVNGGAPTVVTLPLRFWPLNL